jgi:hypothetical protein
MIAIQWYSGSHQGKRTQNTALRSNRLAEINDLIAIDDSLRQQNTLHRIYTLPLGFCFCCTAKRVLSVALLRHSVVQWFTPRQKNTKLSSTIQSTRGNQQFHRYRCFNNHQRTIHTIRKRCSLQRVSWMGHLPS